MGGGAHDKQAQTIRGPDRGVVILFAALTLLGVGILSRYAFLAILFDGLAAVLVVGPAALAGLWLVPLFQASLPHGRGSDQSPPYGRSSDGLPLRWHLLLGAALGLGATSLLILLLGLAGLLQRPILVVLQGSLAVAGAVRLWALTGRATVATGGGRGKAKGTAKIISAFRALRRQRAEENAQSTSGTLPHGRVSVSGGGGDSSRYLWLLACPFLILALLAASNAPGFIWAEEGYGYDVLEYHLQLPKEYALAGQIEYAPHNVYANFPANVEMLYLLGMILLDDTVNAGVTANMIHLAFAALAVFAAWVIGCEWSPRAGIIAALTMATAGWPVYLSGLAYVENGLLFYGLVATGVLLGRSEADATTTLRRFVLGGVIAGFACGCKYTAVPMIVLPLGLAILWLPRRSVRRNILGTFAFATASLVTFSPWLIKNVAMTGNPVFPLANALFSARPPGWGDEETRRWDRGHSAVFNDPSLKDATVRERANRDATVRERANRDATVRERADEEFSTGTPIVNKLSARLGVLWGYIPGDKYQRFGPTVILLALAGLLWQKTRRTDWALATVVIVQLTVWLFATHLFARFAVVLFIPLVLLAGRATPRSGANLRERIVLGVLIAGSGWNLAFAARLGKAQAWQTAGVPASLIYDGRLEGFEYFEVVNHQLPPDSRILMVGDAKAFYFQRDVFYCVVFNSNPFVEAVRAAEDDREVVDWLRSRGFSHVLVNWSEVRRLSRTYGWAEEISPDLFDRLTAAGLECQRTFDHEQIRGRYVELYAVGRPTL